MYIIYFYTLMSFFGSDTASRNQMLFIFENVKRGVPNFHRLTSDD